MTTSAHIKLRPFVRRQNNRGRFRMLACTRENPTHILGMIGCSCRFLEARRDPADRSLYVAFALRPCQSAAPFEIRKKR